MHHPLPLETCHTKEKRPQNQKARLSGNNKKERGSVLAHKKQKGGAKKTQARQGGIPARTINNSSVTSHDVAEEVGDLLATLLSSARDAAMLAAKVSISDEQAALRDKLTKSEQAMKTVYHHIVA